MVRDVLMKKNEEIAHLQMELQNTRQVLQTALQDRDEWRYLAEGTYELNQLLICLVPPMQGTNPYPLASSNELGSTSSCNQAINIGKSALENAHPTSICKVCCASDACMLILPCLHLCACKLCVGNLNVCPICNSAKANVIEARFS
jgi:E3 ubiquitin-protein ligase BOI-like protein